MGLPQLKIPLQEEFCAGQIARLLITGLLVQWLRQHFGSKDNIEDPRLALDNTVFLWTPGKDSVLLINSVTDFDPREADKRPALIVVPGAQTPQRIAIADRAMGTRDGNSRYTRLWQGSHTVMCLSGIGGEAEILAPEVNRELGQFADVVRAYLNLIRMVPAEVGPIGKLEEAQDHYAVPVGLAYAYRESWIVSPQSPLLRALNLVITR